MLARDVHINPISFSDEQKNFLISLFKQHPHVTNFHAYVPYEMKGMRIFLTYSLIKQHRKPEEDIRYEVQEEEFFASGLYGEIFLSKGTLILNNDDLFYKDRENGKGEKKQCVIKVLDKAKVAKAQLLDKYQDVGKVKFANVTPKKEVKLMKKAGHLHVKDLVEDEEHFFIIMRKVQGEKLGMYLASNVQKIKTDYDYYLAIFEAILKAYQEQIASKGLLHNDLHFNNMIIRTTPSGCDISILDFGRASKRKINGHPELNEEKVFGKSWRKFSYKLSFCSDPRLQNFKRRSEFELSEMDIADALTTIQEMRKEFALFCHPDPSNVATVGFFENSPFRSLRSLIDTASKKPDVMSYLYEPVVKERVRYLLNNKNKLGLFVRSLFPLILKSDQLTLFNDVIGQDKLRALFYKWKELTEILGVVASENRMAFLDMLGQEKLCFLISHGYDLSYLLELCKEEDRMIVLRDKMGQEKAQSLVLDANSLGLMLSPFSTDEQTILLKEIIGIERAKSVINEPMDVKRVINSFKSREQCTNLKTLLNIAEPEKPQRLTVG